MEALLCLVVVDDVFLHLKFLRKWVQKRNFSKTAKTLHQKTIKMNLLKTKPKIKNKYSSLQTTQLRIMPPGSEYHSIFQLWQLLRSLMPPIDNLFERTQS